MNEFTLKLKHNSKQPLYQQLYNYIIKSIKDGNIKSAEKLPSKKSLAQHLCLSQTTIETAYQMLLAEGYIYSKPRSGYFVCKIESLPLMPHVSPPKIGKLPPLNIEYEYSFILC